jgi:TatD DNase family protein
MNLPLKGDFIDIHTHDGSAGKGIFILENLMAHEGRHPDHRQGIAYSIGIHPWFLNDISADEQLGIIEKVAENQLIYAIGEAGFDKLKGPSLDLQTRIFEAQVRISENTGKPMIIHCVKAWDELLAARKTSKAKMPWLIHGFRGSPELALQLISRDIYLSFWFDFVMRPESAELLHSLPHDRIFLETDGSETSIEDIYRKVASDIHVTVNELKDIILGNFNALFHRTSV